MGRSEISLAVLTSSRADFGIYVPLLHELRQRKRVKTSLIAFGTHLSRAHGYTVQEIESEGYRIAHRLSGVPSRDSPVAVNRAFARTTGSFGDFW